MQKSNLVLIFNG